ncbi:septum formation family protein [Microbacterium sp. LMI1-1-1.1]|uniref:septum formation family protein n=1 Tax=Microbacterium sp. LMI1-1-1.1 TaxID=3135223 RepID=UPI003465A084
MNTRTRLVLSTVLLTGAVALSGCSIVQSIIPTSSQPVRDAGTGEVTEEVANGDVFSLRVGDCLNSTELGVDTEEIQSVPIVPCSGAHDDEVYSAYLMDDGEYPGADETTEQASAACETKFDTFIGLSYQESELDFWPMTPTPQSWAEGDREVLCIAFDPVGKVTGTLASAQR